MPAPDVHLHLTAAEFSAYRTGRHVIPVDDAVFRFDGKSALDCLQGLLTNDVVKAPDSTAVWGAFLTPKGMIITDAWVIRDDQAAWVIVPGSARATMKQLFVRTIPPRLARVVDRSDELRVHWLCGATPAPDIALPWFAPEGLAPFTALVLSDRSEDAAALIGSGWTPAPPAFADVSRLLGGWPTLGREVDERTLPQEVRFDELGGVRYDKGCYTGQETVARLHFRGHANRLLRGICWAPGDTPSDVDVSDGVKTVGTIRTLARLGDRTFALALLRREVTPGDTVRTGDSEGVVVDPPFDLGETAAA